MMYGISGSTKTSQVYLLAKWLLSLPENKGKKFRMIHSDGGGWAPFQDSGMIDRKEIEVFDFSSRTHSLSDYRKLSQGYWPRKTKDGQEYFRKDDNCKTKPEEWENILGYIIEGMASSGEALKTHISNMTEKVGPERDSFTYEEDGEVLTGLTMSHYNIIQKEIYSAHMSGFNCLPIKWLVYTSLLGKGEDKKTGGETIYGPQLVGSASTPSIPSWFMDCVQLNKEKYMTKDGETEGMVAWFTKHNDTLTGVPCLAKARVLPELYPELLKYFPYGFVPLDYTRGITVYFRVLEKLKESLQQS